MILAERYLLGEQLGAGGMANVFRAVDTRLNVPRAVKVLRLAAVERGGVGDRLRVEARAMARLAHPNVLRVYDVGVDGAVDFIVMDLAQGGSLADVLTDHGPLAPREAARAAIQVLSALEAAHRAGIVHRDVKPQNILVDGRGAALLADFGIALIADSADRKTKTNVAMGSLAYMAPEQRLDARSVTAAADLYALGASIYHLLTDANPIDLFLAEPGSPRWQGVPEPLRPILLRAVRLQPEARYASAAAMALDLAALLTTGALDGAPALPREGEGAATRPAVTLSDDATSTALDWIGQPPDTAGETLDFDATGRAPVGVAAHPPLAPTLPEGATTLAEAAAAPAEAPAEGWAERGGAALLTAALLIAVVVGLWGRPDAAVQPSAPLPAPVAPAAPGETQGGAEAGEDAVAEASVQAAPSAADPAPPVSAAPRRRAAPSPAPDAAPRPAAPPPIQAPEAETAPAPDGAAAAALSGDWTGVFNAWPADLRLETTPGGAVIGRMAVRYSSSSAPVVNRVTGRYDAEARLLTLQDDEVVEDAGRYQATLSPDGHTLRGRFTVTRSGNTTEFLLNRADP